MKNAFLRPNVISGTTDSCKISKSFLRLIGIFSLQKIQTLPGALELLG